MHEKVGRARTNSRNEEVKARNRKRILECVREKYEADGTGWTVLEIYRNLKGPKLARRIIYKRLSDLEAEGKVHREGAAWRLGPRPEAPIIMEESSEGLLTLQRSRMPNVWSTRDFPELRFLVHALKKGKFCRFFRRTFNPQGVEPEDLAEAEAEPDLEKRREIERDIFAKMLSRTEAGESASKDETGRRIGCMYAVCGSPSGNWDDAKGNPVAALRDMFLVKAPYFLDKVIARAVKEKVLSTERFTKKGELRKISDRDLNKLRRWTFGDVHSGPFIVVFSMYPEVLFDWLRLTHEGKEALLEASKSPEVKAEVEKVRSYGKAGKKLSEESRKPRIYQQHREPSAKYYPTRKEVDVSAGIRFATGKETWKKLEKIRRQHEKEHKEERARLRRGGPQTG